MQGGALKINDVAVSDDKARVSLDDVTGDGVIKLSQGKKKHVLVKPA